MGRYTPEKAREEKLAGYGWVSEYIHCRVLDQFFKVQSEWLVVPAAQCLPRSTWSVSTFPFAAWCSPLQSAHSTVARFRGAASDRPIEPPPIAPFSARSAPEDSWSNSSCPGSWHAPGSTSHRTSRQRPAASHLGLPRWGRSSAERSRKNLEPQILVA